MHEESDPAAFIRLRESRVLGHAQNDYWIRFAVEPIMQRNDILGAKASGQKQTGHRSRPVGGAL